MDNKFNVGTILSENNDFNEITHDFIAQKEPDRQAAMKRRIATEDMLSDWKYAINSTNTRELPLNLLRMYEEAYRVLNKILDAEMDIILRR